MCKRTRSRVLRYTVNDIKRNNNQPNAHAFNVARPFMFQQAKREVERAETAKLDDGLGSSRSATEAEGHISDSGESAPDVFEYDKYMQVDRVIWWFLCCVPL